MDLKHDENKAGFSEERDLERSCLMIGTDLRAIEVRVDFRDGEFRVPAM